MALLFQSGAQQADDQHEIFTVSKGLLFRPPASKRLFLQKYQQQADGTGSDTEKFSLSPTTPTTPPAPMSSPPPLPPFSPGPKSDASSTFAPTDSDRGSVSSSREKNSLGDEKRDHFAFPSDSSGSSSSSSTPTHLRVDLIKAIGPDLIPPTTEISTIPCAGVRIASGKLVGLMGWRLIVELLEDDGVYENLRRASWSWKKHQGKGKGKSGMHLKRPAVVGNFILDTGCAKSVVSQEMLRALGYRGKYTPGAEVNNLQIQGIQTQCVVAHLGEASRLGGQFMTSGSLTFYFDNKLNAPVLYVGDEANERPAVDAIPRTVTIADSSDGHPHRRKSFRDSVSSLISLLKIGA